MKILIDKTLYVVGFFSIILFGVFIFGVFMLTGCGDEINGQIIVECGEDAYGEVEDIGNGQLIVNCYPYEENSLTEEETRALIDTLIELSRFTWAYDDNGIYLVDDTVNDLNERVYELESELRDFERFEYEDLIEFMNEFDDWEDVLGAYILELEARIEELESGVE